MFAAWFDNGSFLSQVFAYRLGVIVLQFRGNKCEYREITEFVTAIISLWDYYRGDIPPILWGSIVVLHIYPVYIIEM